MRLVRHSLVEQDIRALAEHILDVTGDPAVALRPLDEIDALIPAILDNPDLGVRLHGALLGCRVRHSGQGRALCIVYRPEGDRLFVALVASAGRTG